MLMNSSIFGVFVLIPDNFMSPGLIIGLTGPLLNINLNLIDPVTGQHFSIKLKITTIIPISLFDTTISTLLITGWVNHLLLRLFYKLQ